MIYHAYILTPSFPLLRYLDAAQLTQKVFDFAKQLRRRHLWHNDSHHNDGSAATAPLSMIVAESEAMRQLSLPQESLVFGRKLSKVN